MKFQFITAIPLDVKRGSGCFVGIQTLAQGLRTLGCEVELITPKLHFPVFTIERILFNEQLRLKRFDVHTTIGFDLDGYALSGNNRRSHIAAIKGVLGDAVRFESGVTRATLAFQAHFEKVHARRADRVITVSNYCAERLEELYGVRNAIVIPELIDLDAWRDLFAANPALPLDGKFIVLCVCRFYPRKRVDMLLRAAAILRERIPGLNVRIVGRGPDEHLLHEMWTDLRLEQVVTWVGNATRTQLAREYNQADVFCLPSVQEGFGIVFLEAMAAGKPIVAVRAAAVPEVVQHGLLVPPKNVEALAEAIQLLYSDSDLRARLGARGKQHVENYAMTAVAAQFLKAVT